MTDKELFDVMWHVNALQEFINQGGMCIYNKDIIVDTLWMDFSNCPHKIVLTINDELTTLSLVDKDTKYEFARGLLVRNFKIYSEKSLTMLFEANAR